MNVPKDMLGRRVKYCEFASPAHLCHQNYIGIAYRHHVGSCLLAETDADRGHPYNHLVAYVEGESAHVAFRILIGFPFS